MQSVAAPTVLASAGAITVAVSHIGGAAVVVPPVGGAAAAAASSEGGEDIRYQQYQFLHFEMMTDDTNEKELFLSLQYIENHSQYINQVPRRTQYFHEFKKIFLRQKKYRVSQIMKPIDIYQSISGAFIYYQRTSLINKLNTTIVNIFLRAGIKVTLSRSQCHGNFTY